MGAAASGPQRGFPFQKSILGDGSREEINLALTSDASALKAIRDNKPFPLGANGSLALGAVQFDWNSSGPVRFGAPGGDLELDISVGGTSGGGVYKAPGQAFQAAGLVDGFALPAAGEDQYLVLSVGYKAAGTLSPSYPIGAIFTAGIDWSAKREGATAVVRRIADSTGAGTAIAEATGQWRLPRQIGKAGDLAPGTWVAARGSGSLSVVLMARAGYTLNFLREVNLLGRSLPVNARIAAALTAKVGLSISGDYMIVAGRESDRPVIRLRIFRASRRSHNAGVDLTVGLKIGKTPSRAGSFVNVMLGLHGLQILSELKILKNWQGETGTLADTPARLDDETARDLLTAASGIDARSKLEQARQSVTQALELWSGLPAKTRAALWETLGDAAGSATLLPFLRKLAEVDAIGAAEAIRSAFAADPSRQSAELSWIASLSDSGSILPLMENASSLRQPASTSATILGDGTLARLRGFIEARLDVQPVTAASGPLDFGKINKWLLAKLGDFLDRKIALGDLAELKLAIAGLQKIEPELASKSGSAFSQLLRAQVAATYERSSSKSALLDADFDLEQPAAAQAFRDLMDQGSCDRLVTERIAGITLHRALLTHEMTRSAEIQVHLPFLDAKRESVNETIAKLQVEEDAGRVLTYELDSKDRTAASGRFRSELAVLCRVAITDGKLDLSELDGATVAYQSRQMQRQVSITDLRVRTRSFLKDMIGGDFATDNAADGFYADLEEHGSTKGRNLGDVALQFQVALPGAVLGGWLRERSASDRKQAALAVSRALQKGLKDLIPRLYLAGDLAKLKQDAPTSALLVWSAIPPSTSITLSAGGVQKWDGAGDVFWDYLSPNLRNAVLYDDRTAAALQTRMAEAAQRWRAAGDERQAEFFDPGQAGKFLRAASSGPGSTLLESLLFTEARMVSGARNALEALRDCWKNADTAPSETLRALADFGSDLSSTFHRRLSVFSGPEALRSFNSFLLAEASAALADRAATAKRQAALTLFFLKDGHAISGEEFLSGNVPPADQLRFARVVVSK